MKSRTKTPSKKAKPRSRAKTVDCHTNRKIEMPFLEQEARLAQKIAAMARDYPTPPCTGTHVCQGDEYPYTRAQEIIKYYRPGLEKHGLVFLQGEIRTFHDPLAYRVECEFRLVDPDTGHGMSVWSAGVGNNGVWSLASAITIAKKEAMLIAFNADWPCEFEERLPSPDSLKSENVFGYSSATDIRRIFGEYFEQVHQEYQKLDKKLDEYIAKKGK